VRDGVLAGKDALDTDFEDVSRLGSRNEERPGEGVHAQAALFHARAKGEHLIERHLGRQLSGHQHHRVENDRVAVLYRERGGDIAPEHAVVRLFLRDEEGVRLRLGGRSGQEQQKRQYKKQH